MKKLKISLSVLLILISISANIYLSVFVIPRHSRHIVKLKRELAFKQSDIDQLLSNQILMIKSAEIRLDHKLEFAIPTFSESSRKVSADSVVGNGKLFFYFDEQYCLLCYKEIISKINQHVVQYGTDNIAIIANFSNMRNLLFFLKNTEVKVPVYYVTNSININATNANQPFFFFLDKSFLPRFVYIPDKKYNDDVSDYISFIDDYLVNKNM